MVATTTTTTTTTTLSTPQHPVGRPAGKEHIPLYPAGFIAIRYVQLILALVILALAAYGVSYVPVDGNSFILAVAVLSMLTSVYQFIAHYGPPAAYNYWAILGLEIFNIIMWLCSFALLTSEVAPLFGQDTLTYNSRTGRYTRTGLTGLALTIAATQMTAAALGGVEFILYVTSLIIHSMRLHRHRAAGLHCMPPSASSPNKPPGGGGGGGVPVYQQQPYPQQQQQQPIPAYLQQQQQQQRQQPYPPQGYPPQPQPQGYPPQPQPQFQPQGYPPQPQPYPIPMPMPGQQVPHPHHHQQQGFYAPVPVPVPGAGQQQQQQQQQPTPVSSPSPATVPASIVPQPTGESQVAVSPLGGQQQQQAATQVHQGQQTTVHHGQHGQEGVERHQLAADEVGR